MTPGVALRPRTQGPFGRAIVVQRAHGISDQARFNSCVSLFARADAGRSGPGIQVLFERADSFLNTAIPHHRWPTVTDAPVTARYAEKAYRTVRKKGANGLINATNFLGERQLGQLSCRVCLDFQTQL